MSQQRILTIEDMRYGIFLMCPKLNFWIHTGETDMLSVIFARAGTVEKFVVFCNKRLSSVWIFPYPVLKSIFNGLLLLLCKRRFFCI